MLLLALAASALASDACPQLEPALLAAEQAAASGRAPDDDPIEAVELALSCAPPVAPAQVARVLRAQGALWHLQGADEEATLAFASAARLDPAGWTESLGPALRERYQAAGARSDRLGSGRLSLSPAPPDAFSTWLDGEERSLPAFVPSGLHLVQVVAAYDAPVAPGLSRSARLALVFDQDDLVVDPGPVPLQPVWAGGTEAALAPPGPSRTRVALLAGGGALALGSGITALIARAQATRAEAASQDFLDNPPAAGSFDRQQQATLDEIDAAEAAQRAWAGTTWALLGLGVGSVGLAFAF